VDTCHWRDEDRADFLKVIDGASARATHFEHSYRLLLPDGRVKHVHALAYDRLANRIRAFNRNWKVARDWLSGKLGQ